MYVRETRSFLIRVQVGAYRDAPARATYYYTRDVAPDYQGRTVTHEVLVGCALGGLRDFVFGKPGGNYRSEFLWQATDALLADREIRRLPSATAIAQGVPGEA